MAAPEALEQFEAAVRIRPEDAEAHNNLGGVLAKLGRFPEATEEFKKALQLDPDLASAHYNLATLQAQQKAP